MDALAWLYGLQHAGVKLGLDATVRLVELLGRPDRAYRSILVGGTNGKGSVAAMLHAMLLAHGRRAGLYTSPHLVAPTERIRIGGDDLDRDELERRLLALQATIETALARGRLAATPSFFETLTALALRAFADHALDVAVLEVGLGGRLDATNVVDADAATIVSVALDHEAILGSRIEQIAREKAGIVKPGRPLVSGVTQQRALDVLREVCHERGATLVDARAAARLAQDDGRAFTIVTPLARYADLQLALAGRHQLDNARIAIAALEALAARIGLVPDPAAVRTALAAVRWPGRLQWVEAAGQRFLFDGAHNLDGAIALERYLRESRAGPFVVLFGAVEDKPATAMLALLRPHLSAIVLTRPSVDRGRAPETIDAGIAPGPRTLIAPDAAHALARARELACGAQPILVCGSLYLVGEILARVTGREPAPIAM